MVVGPTHRVCGLHWDGPAEKQVVPSSLARVTGCEPGYASNTAPTVVYKNCYSARITIRPQTG